MGATSAVSRADAIQNEGQILQRDNHPAQLPGKHSTKSVRPISRANPDRIHFRDLALMAFPGKTDSNLAFHARVDARTARRWLSDDTEPPAEILGLVLAEIMRRFHQR